MTAGQLSYLNSVQIEKIMKDLQDCLKLDDYSKSMEIFHRNIENELFTLKRSFTPLELSLNLSGTCQDLNSRMKSAELAIVGKMDRSEMGNLETLSSRLKMYDTFRDITTNHLEQLQTDLQIYGKQLETLFYHKSSSESDVDDLKKQVSMSASRSEMRNLAQVIDFHTQQLSQCSLISNLDQVRFIC
jgi:hypothetical protein